MQHNNIKGIAANMKHITAHHDLLGSIDPLPTNSWFQLEFVY